MTIDLRNILRRRKPEKRLSRLSVRASRTSTSWSSLGSDPAALLLDTSVYIHQANGHLPADLRNLVDRTLLFHCTVALGELAVGVANADPRRSGWVALRDHYADLFDAIPDSRVLTPDGQTWLEAGVIAGTLARIPGYQSHQRKACLNDALIFLTAARAGLPVLTANRDEFDLIRQLAPEGFFVHY